MNYNKIYNQLISKCQIRQLHKDKKELIKELGYVENHHIIPKSMGGSNDKSNLVFLTAKEHFVAHWLLRNIHQNMQMSRAFLFLATYRNNRINSRTFEKLKNEQLKDKNIYTLENIDTNEIFIGNRKQILSEINLSASDLSEIINQKCQRRRWKLKDISVNDRSKLKYDLTIYNFENILTNEKFSGSWREFVNHANVKAALCGRLILGKIKHTKNWKLENTILSNHSKSQNGSYIYSFIHLENNDKFVGLCKDFIKYSSVGQACCYELIRGKTLQTKGWSLNN